MKTTRIATSFLLGAWGHERPAYSTLSNWCIRVPACVLATLCFVAAQAANADPVTRTSNSPLAHVTVTASTDAVQVAEPFSVEWKVVVHSSTKVVFPTVTGQLGPFQVLDHDDFFDIPSDDSPAQRTWTRRMTLDSIVTGDLQIPSLEIHVTGKKDTAIVATPTISFRVTSVLEDRADPSQFRDIHSVVDVPVPNPAGRAWVWWTVSGIGVLSLTAASVAMVARRKTWQSPRDWAMAELEHLKSSAAWQSGHSEIVCRELSTILRDYLDLQFEVPANVKTTQELLGVIKINKILDPAATQQFAELFAHADQSKFAGLELTQPELSRAIDDAIELVERTANQLQVETSIPQSMENY